MGHYRSEMVSQEEIDRENRENQERRRKRAEKIRAAIDAEGIEFVLADIIDDPRMASTCYHAH